MLFGTIRRNLSAVEKTSNLIFRKTDQLLYIGPEEAVKMNATTQPTRFISRQQQQSPKHVFQPLQRARLVVESRTYGRIPDQIMTNVTEDIVIQLHIMTISDNRCNWGSLAWAHIKSTKNYSHVSMTRARFGGVLLSPMSMNWWGKLFNDSLTTPATQLWWDPFRVLDKSDPCWR